MTTTTPPFESILRQRMASFMQQFTKPPAIVAYQFEGSFYHPLCMARRMFILLGSHEDPIEAIRQDAESFGVDINNPGPEHPRPILDGSSTERLAVCSYCEGAIHFHSNTL